MGSLSRPRYRKAWARARISRSPHCPLRGNRQWAARNQWAAQVRAPQPAAPAGPVVLVDHLLVANCGKFPGQAFAGYAADDVMGAGARPAFASEVTFGMIMDNMGCCKNPYQGLEVPVYLSTIDAGNGKITDRNFEAARLHFDVVPACQCPCDNTPISGRVVKAGVAYPVVSHGGPSACPQCIADADMTVNSTTLKGTLYPCCVQPCCDTPFVRPVEGEPGAGMYRWILQPCASGPGRDHRVVIKCRAPELAWSATPSTRCSPWYCVLSTARRLATVAAIDISG